MVDGGYGVYGMLARLTYPITATVLTLTADLMGGIEKPDTWSRVVQHHIDLLLH